jgi:hypothetical protein
MPKSGYQILHASLSACPLGTTRLPLDGFSLNFILEYFFKKYVEEAQSSLKSDDNNGYFTLRGHALAQWLRHCATNRKVAGSIPNGVIEIFH